MEQMEWKHECDLERLKRRREKRSGEGKDAEYPLGAQNTSRRSSLKQLI